MAVLASLNKPYRPSVEHHEAAMKCVIGNENELPLIFYYWLCAWQEFIIYHGYIKIINLYQTRQT